MAYTLDQLATAVGGEVRGQGQCAIDAVATLRGAGPGQITFLANNKYRKYLTETQASAVIVSTDAAEDCPVNAIVVSNPHLAFAKVVNLLNPRPSYPSGIHPLAVIDPQAVVDSSASIAANVVVEADAVIKAGVRLGPGCVIGKGSRIGIDSELHPNVTVYAGVFIGARAIIHSGSVIGSDGFGFANERGKWIKIAQIGRVIIGDDVEIGANTTIDCGALEDTIISNGVKIDNLVQIAHNVQIGSDSIVAGCVGIAGSAVIGSRCALGGGVGVAGHLEICDNVTVTGMTLVSRSINEPGVYSSGIPAVANAKWNKTVARLRHLDELADRIKGLERNADNKKV